MMGNTFKGDNTVNTVLGPISVEELGVTLMHEHIIWNWDGTNEETKDNYDRDEVVDTMLPYLLRLKKAGCQTLVEATTSGAGRDVEVLKECSRRSGLNIITNVGAWDGGEFEGRLVPKYIKEKEIDEIVNAWVKEDEEGINETEIKPGFVKLALGDTGSLTELQEKLLRAGIRTSMKTGLPVQCHNASLESIVDVVKIVEEEGLPYNKFIWVHADFPRSLEMIMDLGKKGIWLEFDCLARAEDFQWHVELIPKLVEEKLLDRTLFSQDAGTFNIGEENDENSIFPYDRIFTEFLPLCKEQGISQEVIDQIFVTNPGKVLIGCKG